MQDLEARWRDVEYHDIIVRKSKSKCIGTDRNVFG